MKISSILKNGNCWNFVILGLLLISPPLFSQTPEETTTTHTDKRNLFTFSTGFFLNDSRDLTVSLLHRLGLGGGAKIQYQHIAPSHYHNVAASGHAGALFAGYHILPDGELNYEDRTVDLDILLNLNYSSQFKVLNTPLFTLYTGFSIDGNLDFWLIQNFLSYGWSATFTIGPALMMQFKLKKHHFRIHYQLPIIGALSRPFFNVYNFALEEVLENSNGLIDVLLNILLETTELYHWGKAFRTTTSLDYEWHLTQKVGLHAHYGATLEYYGVPQDKSKLGFIQEFHIGVAVFW